MHEGECKLTHGRTLNGVQLSLVYDICVFVFVCRYVCSGTHEPMWGLEVDFG